MAALTYEIILSRMLQIVFGSTVHTVSTVLCGFLLGFSIGALVFGIMGERIRRPLFWMALMQWAIGIYSLCLIAVLKYAASNGGWIPEGLALKALAAVVLLLPPTILLGALWPLFTQYFVQDTSAVGSDAAGIYLINSFGSAAGAFAAGFLLLPLTGITVTTAAACGMNFLAGLVFISIDRTTSETS